MSTATLTTGLAPAQWRVLNRLVLNDTLGRRQCHVGELLARQDANVEDLLALAERGLICGVPRAGYAAMHAALTELFAAPGVSARSPVMTGLRLLPVAKGIKLVWDHHPNSLLMQLMEKPQGAATLRDVMYDFGIPVQVVVQTELAGWVSLFSPGLPAPPSALVDAPRAWWHVTVRLTSRGRRYLPRA